MFVECYARKHLPQAVSDEINNILCNGIVDRYFFSIIINYDDLVSILVSIFQITVEDNHMNRLFNPLSGFQVFNIMKKMIFLSILSISFAAMCDAQEVQDQKGQTKSNEQAKERFKAMMRCYERYHETLQGKETRHYTQKDYLKTKNSHCRPPVHQAVYDHDIECIEVLLEAEDHACQLENDPNITNYLGDTALHYVLLLTKLDDPTKFPSHKKMEKELIPKITKALIEGGADVHATNSEGKTALHLAAYYGSEETVKVLLKHDANSDVFTKDDWGRTPKDWTNYSPPYAKKAPTTAQVEIRSMLEQAEAKIRPILSTSNSETGKAEAGTVGKDSTSSNKHKFWRLA